MRINNTKAKLSANQTVVGAGIAFPSPDLIELCAAVGFDFISIDAEHEAMSDEQIIHMIRAAEAYNVTPIVRLPQNPDLILRFLNAGAQGIHVPRCNTAADLRALVQWTRFYPQGERTFYNRGRSGDFSIGITDSAEWSQAANRELLVIGMVEEIKAIDNLDDMLAVPYIDAIHIGHMDLWQSMGMPAGMKGVYETIAQITPKIAASGKHVSHTMRVTEDILDRIAEYIRLGSRMFIISPLDFIRQNGVTFTKGVREIEKNLLQSLSRHK